MNLYVCTSLMILLFARNAFAAEAVNIKDFGATGDGVTLDSGAIQKAIDAVAAKGGGTVNIPTGTYLCGSIILKSNITLHLEDGAQILGTTDLSQYKNVDPFKDGLGAEVGTAFIVAVDAKNIAIEGKGTLNGNGKAVAAAKSFKGEGWGFRPMLLRLVRCDGVRLKDFQLKDSASWTTNFSRCKNVTVDGLKIDSHVAPHNDGINIDSTQGMTITNCDIDSGDDGLVLKSTLAEPCKDITATKNRIKSRHGAIKLGTESYGGFENIRISHCYVYDTRNGGIKVLCVDGGHLNNVVISDIEMDNVKTPIFVRLGARLKTFRSGDEPKTASRLSNVIIRNVKAKADPEAQIMPPSGIFITGVPDHKIENLTLENIEISLAGGGEASHAQAVVEENPKVYPEINRFGKTLPAYGIFARHVKGLSLKNVNFKLDKPDARPAMVCEDVQDLSASGCAAPAGENLIRMDGTLTPQMAGFKASP